MGVAHQLPGRGNTQGEDVGWKHDRRKGSVRGADCKEGCVKLPISIGFEEKIAKQVSQIPNALILVINFKNSNEFSEASFFSLD